MFRCSAPISCCPALAGTPAGLLIPGPAYYLRIALAQALFHDLALDLSKLLAVRALLRPAVVTAARAEAGREGWRAGFDGALAAAGDALLTGWTVGSRSACRS